MNNNNPTLIPGFEDIMVHIRNQEKRIKELEKVNREQFALNRVYKEEKEDIHKQYKKKIDTLISQKHELEAKVDEAQVAFRENVKYKKEFQTIQNSVEEECQASGIMEVMNSRIENAENELEEYILKYEETRKRANEQTQNVITQNTIIRNLIQTMIENDKNGDLWDDGIELSTDWNLYGTGRNYHNIIEEEIDCMNHDDWNEDDNRTKIIYEGHRIRVEINDTSSEEETDEDA